MLFLTFTWLSCTVKNLAKLILHSPNLRTLHNIQERVQIKLVLFYQLLQMKKLSNVEERKQLLICKRLSISPPGLPTLCLKKVWKLREALNVLVTVGHRPAQVQEEPAGWGHFPRFCLKTQNFFAK